MAGGITKASRSLLFNIVQIYLELIFSCVRAAVETVFSAPAMARRDGVSVFRHLQFFYFT